MLTFSSGNFLKCSWMFNSSLSIHLSVCQSIYPSIYDSIKEINSENTEAVQTAWNTEQYWMQCLEYSFWSIAFGSCFTVSSQIYRPAQWCRCNSFTSKGVIYTKFEIVNIDWMDFFSMNSVWSQSLTTDLSVLSMEESLKFK